ncbi:MAG: hypothetical protein JWR13_3153 [Mycobacterium sp.]|nr:hypothetical protein [Mycobacterium sp.]
MPTTITVEKLQHLLADLMQCVTSLHSTYGDTPAMRRIINDANGIRNGIHRLQIDVDDLGLTSAVIPCTRSAQMIQISDDDYDVSFWRDVDHEGVGSQSLACAPVPRKRR